jgi:hypothetical protein
MQESFGLSLPAVGLLRRWEHHSASLLMAAIGLSVLLGVQSSAADATAALLRLALLAFVLCTWLLMRRHARRLCETCVGAMPLNVAERAVRYRRRFALTHAGTNPRVVVPYLLVLLGSNALLVWPAGRWIWAPVQLSMIYLVLAQSTHGKYQPWCPGCASDGGGSSRGSDDVPDLPRGGRLRV